MDSRTVGWAALFLVSALPLGGCGEDTDAPAPPSFLVNVVDSAGVEIVESGVEGAWGPGVREVEEVLRIGVVEGDEPYQFFDVRDVAVDPEGRIYVVNGVTATVRVFESGGRFLREFGGQGQGPGEFVQAGRIHLAHDGIRVVDRALLRVTAFTFQGRPLDTWRFILDDVLSLSHWTPQGWLGVVFRRERPRPARAPPGTPDTIRVFLNRVGPASDPSSEALSAPVLELPPRVLYATFHGTRWDWPLFHPRPQTGVDGSGRIYFSPGEPYQVEVFSPEGDLLRRIRRPVTLRPLGPEVASELVAHARRFFLDGEFTGTRSFALRQLEEYTERVEWQASFPMGDHLPPTGRLLLSPDGSFWLERTDDAPPARLEFERTFPTAREGEDARRATTWDLFDARGHFLGQARLPPAFTPHEADGPTVIGVERDEMGVEYVVAYRVELL